MRRFALFALLALMLGSSGCGTLVSSAERWPKPDYFGGVRYDARVIRDPVGSDEYAGFAVFDMPLSLVLDIGFLPINGLWHLGQWAFGGDDEPKP